MYHPLESAPPAFMKRYTAIMNGDEKLDTVQKLKDFWLFGIEQGWPHPEMREHIARLMLYAFYENGNSFPFSQYPTVRAQALSVESATVIADDEKKGYDLAWTALEGQITSLLLPEDYDASTPLDMVPPIVMKRYNAIMNGDEKLDTVQKLKDFWLFGIEQGWPHPEMRIGIVRLILRATIHAGIFSKSFKEYGRVWAGLINIHTLTVTGDFYAQGSSADAEKADYYWDLAEREASSLS